MAQPETRLVESMRRAIRKRWPDAFVVKLHGGPHQTAGLPDLLVLVGGRAAGIEAKRQQPGESEEHARNRATPRQLDVLSRMDRGGAATGVALTVEEALDIVECALRT